MDDDISNMVDKFKTILNDKNIDINNIISNSNNNSSNTETNNNCSNTANTFNDVNMDIDIDMILKIKDILSKINNNKNSKRNILLNSLKPYLAEEKLSKLDQYIKIANLLSVIEEMNIDIPFLKNENKKGYDSILIITLILLII